MADLSLIKGKERIDNYSSALEDREQITLALKGRVLKGQTSKVGPWRGIESLPHDNARIVPLGSIRKKLEPEVARIISDHTATGLNAAIQDCPFTMQGPRHIMDAMRPSAQVGVMDVKDAFPSLDISEKYKPYLYVVWYDVDPPPGADPGDDTMYLYRTECGDFGVKSLPYLWDRWLGCLLDAGESYGCTQPTCKYVDDLTFVGDDAALVDQSMDHTAALLAAAGHEEKRLKRAPAAPVNSALGIVFDCTNMTAGVTPEKLSRLKDQALAALSAKSSRQKDVQSIVGLAQHISQVAPPYFRAHLDGLIDMSAQMERASRRLPGGAPNRHRRQRITARARDDLLFLVNYVDSWSGVVDVYNGHRPRARAPPVWTDASGGEKAGGGWCTDRHHEAWTFDDPAERRKGIAYLEALAVLRAAECNAHEWYGCIVPLWIDNESFYHALIRHRSRSSYLNGILRDIFVLASKFNWIFEPKWLSSKDNARADALSRADLVRYNELTTQPTQQQSHRLQRTCQQSSGTKRPRCSQAPGPATPLLSAGGASSAGDEGYPSTCQKLTPGLSWQVQCSSPTW